MSHKGKHSIQLNADLKKGYKELRPLNQLILKILCSDQGHLLANCRIEREKFYPGPGLEPGPLAFRANALTNWAIQDMYRSTIELIS